MKKYTITLDIEVESKISKRKMYEMLDNIAIALQRQIKYSEMGLAPTDNVVESILISDTEYDNCISYDVMSDCISTI